MMSTHRAVSRLLILISGCLIVSDVCAQGPDRPRLAIDFQGPVGKTRAVGFLPNGNRLFAAGEGKVVELFDIQGQRVTLAGSGRWEFARGARGEINDVAVTRDGRFAFLAGASARGLRDVVIMDLTTRSIVGVLPNAPSGRGDSVAHNFTPILSVAIAPDASFAASASRNGEVWLWDLRNGFNNASGRMLRGAEKVNSEYNPLAFAGPNTLLYSSPTTAGRTSFRAKEFDILSGQSKFLSDVFRDEVSAITVSADGQRIVISSTDGRITVRRAGPASESAAFSLPHAGVIRNAIISPSGNSIAVMGDTKDLKQSFLSLVAAEKIQIIDTVGFEGREACVTASFNRDGSRLMSHDNSQEVLLVWKLVNAAGGAVAKPLTASPLSIGGRGQTFVRGRFLRDKSSQENGYHVNLVHSNGVQQYSFSDGGLEPVENVPLIDGNTFAGGWRVSFQTTNSIVNRVQLTSPQNTVHTISVDLQKQGELTGTHCFIPDSNGRPLAIAIGTRTIDGIYVYSLAGLPATLNGADNLVRYFRDHSGEISDLSVSSDGRFLLSTSEDKTSKVWSLAALSNGGKRSIYGSDISIQNGRVTVSSVLKQGILYGRKLRDNDRIIRAENLDVPEGGFTDSQRIVNLLQGHSPFDEMYLWTDRLGDRYQPGGDDDRIVIVPGWEPLMTLMVDKTEEWVLYTPEGYYNASPAEGHRLFGWQLNRGRAQTPRFEPAGNLQKEFEKPGIMKDILRLGSVSDALVFAGEPVPNDFQISLSRKLQNLPEINITAPQDNALVAAQFVLQAAVSFPAGVQPNQFDVRADLGGKSLGTAAGVLRNGVMNYTWRTQANETTNRIRVTAKEKNGSFTRSLATDRHITVRAPQPPEFPKPRIYVLAFGAEKYKSQPQLAYAIDDAKGVFDSLQSHPELARDFAKLSALRTDAEVTKSGLNADVSRVLKEVQERQNPNDLILIYATGHGVLGNGDDGAETFYYLPPAVDSNNAGELQRDGVMWSDFAAMVNDAPCNVIWSIDACHAGAASESAKKTLNRDSTGTGRRCVFLSTSEASELARENKFAVVKEDDDGHGWFSMAFIETLVGNDLFPEVAKEAKKLRENGLDTEEMGEYVFRRVKDATDNNQRPVFTPKFISPSTSTGQPITLLSQPGT